MKRVLVLGVALVAMLALGPAGAQAQTAPECGWYKGAENGAYPYTPAYWCYTPDSGWQLVYSMAEDMRLHRLYGYDAYDGDGGYYTPQRFIPWDCIEGIGRLKEGC